MRTMTDRERLIGLIINADTYDSYECKLCAKDDDACECCFAEKLADHLLANGVIVPPCNVGDTVYSYGARQVREWKITFVGKNSRNEYKFIAVVGKFEDLLVFWHYEIGKTVFLTKDEAEQALKEREQNDR